MHQASSLILSRYSAVALAAIFAACSAHPAAAQVSAEESTKKLKPAEGLEVSLWASEPMVVNPTNIDIDSRGRVWVTEGLNYRLTRGGNRQFQRIEGADRIKILEDTNGDGKADKVTVFADNVFPVPMGIAVEEHWSKDGKYQGARVFIGNSPDLLVLEDTNGDDVADKRYPLLTGFGGIDSDHGVHGMALGPDGKLYFTHGDGCCSVQPDKSERPQNFDVIDKSGRRVSTDQLGTVLRCNRDGTNLEILATRLRNDYECAVDSFGNVFASDNDDDGNRGSRVVWIMNGGNYGYRTPGSRLHWGEDIPGIIPKLAGTGNGSPCGVMVYEGAALPELYRGALLEAEAGPRVIFAFPLKRVGAGFRTETHVMLSSDDDWFRPVDVCAAPDGSVFIADWYDGGVGGHAFRDQTTGRIYRLAAKDHPASEPLDFSSIAGLTKALESPNVAARDAARRLLIEHGDQAIQALRGFDPEGRTRQLARVMWVAGDIPGSDMRASLARAMESAGERFMEMDPQFREIATRITATNSPPEVNALLAMAADPDPGVRREVILALKDMPTERAGETLKKLAASWDGQDRYYLEALGLALRHREPEFISSLFDGSLYGDLNLEANGKAAGMALPPYFPADRNEAYLKPGDALRPANALTKTLGLMWQLYRPECLPLLAKIIPALQTPDLQQAEDDVIALINDPSGAPLIAEMIAQLSDDARKARAMLSLARKLDGPWRRASGDAKIVAIVEPAFANPALRHAAVVLAGAARDQRYAQILTKLVGDDSIPIDTRVATIEALTRMSAPNAEQIARRFVEHANNTQKASPLAEASMRALVQMNEPSERLGPWMTSETMPLALRREALRGLVRRRDAIDQVLAMARDNALPADLRLETATLLRAHPDRAIRDQALELFPIRSKDGKPLPPTGEILRREGDSERGKAVFFASESGAQSTKTACASCHRVQGEGQWIGPDLSTIGTKYGKDELLNSILNPSAAISYTFRSVVVATADGRVQTGLVVEDAPDRLVLKTAEGQRVTIDPTTIEERRDSDLSLMPEGLIENISEQELVDLIAYLATLKQPVSIVGEARIAGPWRVADQARDLPEPIRPTAPLTDAAGHSVPWRLLRANAEGAFTLPPDGEGAFAVHIAIESPTAQAARLVVDSDAADAVWLNGKLLSARKGIRAVDLALPSGTSDLNLRLWSAKGTRSDFVLTVIADSPVSFGTPSSEGQTP